MLTINWLLPKEPINMKKDNLALFILRINCENKKNVVFFLEENGKKIQEVSKLIIYKGNREYILYWNPDKNLETNKTYKIVIKEIKWWGWKLENIYTSPDIKFSGNLIG